VVDVVRGAASACDIAWTIVGQAALGARNEELLAVVTACESETATQLKWLKTRLKEAAPQTLVVACATATQGWPRRGSRRNRATVNGAGGQVASNDGDR
jgi:hypothetical protein